MTAGPLTAHAPGKINLVLEVLGLRDDGYHELRSVMQTLELADRVSIELDAATPGVVVSGPYTEGTPADRTNLAWRAAEYLAGTTGHDLSALRITIEKRLPAASGVGGGASDAATTLKLLARAWGIADEQILNDAANSVGSDEPFFLIGGTALTSGRGETVAPLAPLPPHDVVLFVPPSTIANKTGSLFKALASTPFDDGSQATRFCMFHPRPISVADTFNAFERVAFDQFAGLAALAESISASIRSEVRLAGAGPTLFWIGASGAGPAIAESAGHLSCNVILTGTSP